MLLQEKDTEPEIPGGGGNPMAVLVYTIVVCQCFSVIPSIN